MDRVPEPWTPGEDAVAPSRDHGIRAPNQLGSAKDRWPSGLRHTLGKRAWCNSHRGFESRPVRQVFIVTCLVSRYADAPPDCLVPINPIRNSGPTD